MELTKGTTRSVKKIETKQKLLDAAKRLFSCSSFECVKVEDITKEAGLAKGTFFTHFESKEDVVSEVQLVATYDRLMPALSSDGPIVPQIKKALAELLMEGSESKSLMRAVLLTKLKDNKQLEKQAEHFQQFYKGMAELVEKGKIQGEIRKDIDSFEVVRMVEQVYLGVLMQWCLVIEDTKMDDFVQRSFDVLFEGLQPNH